MDRLARWKVLVRLAVLSAEATSDPHALDGGTLSGKLFLYLLAFRSGAEFPENAEQRDWLYYENGILCDSISSLVTQVGLPRDHMNESCCLLSVEPASSSFHKSIPA